MKPAAHKTLMSRNGRRNPFFVGNTGLEQVLLDCGYIFRRHDGLFDLTRKGRDYIANRAKALRRAA